MSHHVNAIALPLQQYDDQVREAIRRSKAQATIEAYKSDLKLFAAWCEKHKLNPLPATPQTICRYLAEMAATKKVSTMQRVLVSISQAHKAAQLESPTAHISVRATMGGFRRTKGVKRNKKAPLLAADFKKIFMTMEDPDHALAVRDRALLLVGFAGAFRRSELAAMKCEDIRFTDEGMVINLPKSKTDQEGQGRDVAMYRGGALCAIRALQAWLRLSGVTTGKIWRVVHWSGAIHSTQTLGRSMVARVVKRHAASIGKDPAEFGGHSLRRGFVTAAILGGAQELAIMRTTGHRSLAMVREYIDEANPFANNASGMIGL